MQAPRTNKKATKIARKIMGTPPAMRNSKPVKAAREAREQNFVLGGSYQRF